MKILLINPIVTTERAELLVPLNLVYLSSAIKRDSAHSAFPLDLSYEFLQAGGSGGMSLLRFQQRCVDRVWDEHGPFDLVGISGLCDNFPFTVRLCDYIKKRFQSRVVLGGPHASFCARELLETVPSIDCVVRFDGVPSLRRLCEALSGALPLDGIPNLSFRSGRGIIENPGVGRREDGVLTVDPDYDVLPIQNYLTLNPQLRFPILAGTGCPYDCIYCSTSLMWQRRYQVRSPSDIGRDIARLKSAYQIESYGLVHDNLLCNRSFALSLCQELGKQRVSWHCSSRVDHLQGDGMLLDSLGQSGCRGIFIGLESASPRVQKSIRKNSAVEQASSVAQDLIGRTIKPIFSFIVGFPEESVSERDSTIRLAVRLRAFGAERVNINSLSPLPGTELARRPLRFRSERNGLSLKSLIPSSGSWIALIRSSPAIFASFYYLESAAGPRLGHALVGRLHELCNQYPRAFDHLFSQAGLPPHRIFPLVARKSLPGLVRAVGRLVRADHARVFQELIRYESAVNALAKKTPSWPSVRSRPAGAGRDWLARRYVLSGKAALLRSSIQLSTHLRPAAGAAGRLEIQDSFLCLFDSGERIETYAVPKALYSILTVSGGNGPKKSLRSLIRSGRNGRADPTLARSLKKLVAMGVLQ